MKLNQQPAIRTVSFDRMEPDDDTNVPVPMETMEIKHPSKEDKLPCGSFGMMSLAMRVPTKLDYHPRSRLVHGILRYRAAASFVQFPLSRGASTNSTDRAAASSAQLEYAVQHADGTETTVLRAVQRGHTRCYDIYDATSKTTSPIAVLQKSWTNASSIAYALSLVSNDVDDEIPCSNDNHLFTVACIVYTIPSLLSALVDAPARQAEMVLRTETAISHELNHQENDALLQCCQKEWQSSRTLQRLVRGENNSLVALQHKDAYDKGEGRYGLNFCGRGKETSRKNMQLTDAKGRVVAQIAKLERHVYHVDHRAPLSPLQAMGFAIAQCDL
ncbi:predicted protein [Phaeodactylum tricornutum CCAP 1055/1]|jgi:hypothetical protein|uniref:Tubby C-terminal domain-containing protein n=1 Tax=Phaeodactylum tricornutum (strain CCAP 1055/1) TaxID=556484 RepID=B7S3N6_PHATC|nr:predicted protein [Phaeodactylum tricornutum CCAP 1055/1]EEC42827.1 predicted protein [Phaeodactylum tricornutum CCAP 1055/1]|eukprot:XP_002176174.1 predicted protein [Phaeodactylum tricornutum CCAP 1055/1]